MSAPPSASSDPVTSKDDLISKIERGCKPESDWRIGTEHEKLAFCVDTLKPVPYDGPRSIRALLEGLQRFGWQPIMEGGDTLIGLADGMANISLEPGGQVELSGAPLETLHQTCEEVHEHLRQVRTTGRSLGISMLGLGFNPKWARAEIPMMPKGRYKIMRAYMPTRGSLGLDMMLRTCTIQVNLDFKSEADMVKKMRVGVALQPIATALFANSPFTEGKPNGFLSFRSNVWTDTDPDRTGTLPFVFEDGFGFERYVDYILDVPMYFVYRDGKYLDASGLSFRDFMTGTLPILPGEVPTKADWSDHLTTVFPEVRLKNYIEMRGADGGEWSRICALPAFWVGLLYDSDALDAAWDIAKDWTLEERLEMRRDVPRFGLAARIRNQTVQDIALRVLEISAEGLKKRGYIDSAKKDESVFLAPLRRIAESGETPAEELLKRYHGAWNGSVDPVYTEFAY